MSISTKEVKKNYISKELKPGNVVAKINNISILEKKEPKDKNNPEYTIFLELESKPIGNDFVGFDKVFGDASKGQYAGQTKKIKVSDYPIKTNEGVSKKTGKPYKILASSKILNFLQKLLTAVDKESWLNDNDNKFDTWEQLFSAINRNNLLKDKYLSWCIGGTESLNANGYTVYYMWLPEIKEASIPFAAEGKLITTFDSSIHITKSKAVKENNALNSGVDEDNSVAREDDEFSNPPVNDPFDDDLDDSELFDMDED